MNPNVIKQALSLLQPVAQNVAKGYQESPAQFGQNTNAGMAETAGNYIANAPGVGELGALGGAISHTLSPALSHLPLAVGAIKIADSPMKQALSAINTPSEAETLLPDLGKINESDQTFLSRTQGRMPSVKIPGGSVRDVYDLGNGYVAKIANHPRGLEQNDSEGDMYAPVPDVIERGKDYVITQKASRNDSVARQFLAPLQSFTQEDFNKRTPELQDALEKTGLSDLMNYDALWNDIKAPRNWGFINGEPKLIDAGALNNKVTATSTPSEYAQKDWQDVLSERKQTKKSYPSDMSGTLGAIKKLQK